MHTRRNQSSRLMALPMDEKRKAQLPVSPEVTGVRDQSQSQFMGLSSELRNRIYELSFNVTCEVPSGHKGNPKGLTAPPGLLLACKQTYAEGLKTYYSTAKFRIHTVSRALAFFSKVASKNGHGPALTSVTVIHEEALWYFYSGFRLDTWNRPRIENGGKKAFVNVTGKDAVQKAQIQSTVLKMEHWLKGGRRTSQKLTGRLYIGTWAMQDGQPVLTRGI
ncbi:hypothetical protein AC579_5660 [Pseudocercospora musae]|uniref:Uncharacterized protein n=1 Tax=Pseudocercospora musae TaxID=113226 RepID=A0A139ICE6_9PEZI|nr:hypothetical protein AC579_5660 [Pseudocercospora musae]